MMLLRAPEAVTDVLWEGMLKPETRESVERSRKTLDSERSQAALQADLRNLPIISIGRPEVWPLPEVYPPDKMPPLLKARLEEADFYLIRAVCSFRPIRETSRLSWARLWIRLLPDSNEQQPLAYDLYPKDVFQEVKRHIKVSLSPTINFQELQAGIGGVEFGLEYPELQPIISATGIGEKSVEWTFEEASGIRLQGSKTMHLLVKAPKGMSSSWATLDLVANVKLHGWFSLPALIRKGRQDAAADPLEVRLW